MSEEIEDRIWRVFFPETVRQVERIREKRTRFVHYTSAETGIAILRSNRMLLRNSTLMNDFSEVHHGMSCLNAAVVGPTGDRLKLLMDKIQSGLSEIVISNFNDQYDGVQSGTYLISISEHGDPEHGDVLEDQFGRLSMWRAYANKNGIAFVFKNTPFVSETNVLNAYTSPVLYETPDSFERHFTEVVDGIEREIDLLVSKGGQFFHDNLLNVFRFAVQSTKHPSFREEREWRVIYSPSLLLRDGLLDTSQVEKIPTEIMSLGGVPQRVYAIPFKNYPEEGFVGATVPELVDRIIIGPSQDALTIAHAFVDELTRCGVEKAHEKVTISGVPLRV